MIWDNTIKRQLWILILGIWGAFGFVLFELLAFWDLSQMWTSFIVFVWYALDAFIGAYLWHAYKISRADIPVATPILTKVKTAPEIEPEALTKAGVTTAQE